MAAYPADLPVCIGTTVKVESGIEIDRATNGAARGRSLYTSDKRTFTLVHSALDAAQRATLAAFYASNKTVEFDFSFDGTTYACLFAAAPQPEWIGGGRAHLTVEIVEA